MTNWLENVRNFLVNLIISLTIKETIDGNSRM